MEPSLVKPDKEIEGLKGKTVLLTGGAGFIGSHIAEKILKIGVSKLVIVDNLSTGNIDNLKSTGVLSDSRVFFYHTDVTDVNSLKDIFGKEDIDMVCHQAAIGSVPRSIQDPANSHKSNVDGFFNILDIARQHGVKRFVYASSSSVYGDNETLPKVENDVGEVISPYAATKKINEIYANVFTKCYGMECIGLRYFNVFGPRQSVNGPYAAVIPRFAIAIKNKERPIIYGTGEQSRDFTYVENAVNANILALTITSSNISDNTSVNTSNTFGTVYNVATGGRVNLNEMYNIMKEVSGAVLDPIYENSREGDIEHSWASIEKADNILGYTPTVSFMDGLRITLASYTM